MGHLRHHGNLVNPACFPSPSPARLCIRLSAGGGGRGVWGAAENNRKVPPGSSRSITGTAVQRGTGKCTQNASVTVLATSCPGWLSVRLGRALARRSSCLPRPEPSCGTKALIPVSQKRPSAMLSTLGLGLRGSQVPGCPPLPFRLRAVTPVVDSNPGRDQDFHSALPSPT